MRLGKKEAAGYVADTETDEIPDMAAPADLAPAELAAGNITEPAAREPEKAAAAG